MSAKGQTTPDWTKLFPDETLHTKTSSSSTSSSSSSSNNNTPPKFNVHVSMKAAVKSMVTLDQFYPPMFCRNVHPDGMCFFYSVFDQLWGRVASRDEIQAFRRAFFKWVHTWILSLLDAKRRKEILHSIFPTWQTEEDDVKLQNLFQTYIKVKSGDVVLDNTTYLDQSGILLFATYLQRPIQIYSFHSSMSANHFIVNTNHPLQHLHASFAYSLPTAWLPHGKRPLLIMHYRTFLNKNLLSDGDTQFIDTDDIEETRTIEHYDSLSPLGVLLKKDTQNMEALGRLQSVYQEFPGSLTHIRQVFIDKPLHREFVKRYDMFTTTLSSVEEAKRMQRREAFRQLNAAEIDRRLSHATFKHITFLHHDELRDAIRRIWLPNTRVTDSSIYAFCRMWTSEWNTLAPSIHRSLLLVQDTMFFTQLERFTADQWQSMAEDYSSTSSIKATREAEITAAYDKPFNVLKRSQEHSTQPWTTSPFQYNEWLIPIYVKSNQHFFLLHVHLLDRVVFIFDPLPPKQRNVDHIERVCNQVVWFTILGLKRRYAEMHALFPQWTETIEYKTWGQQLVDRLDYDKWTYYQAQNQLHIPFQDNGFDCGIFVMKYIEVICRDLDNSTFHFDWDTKDIPRIRHEFAERLLHATSSSARHEEGKGADGQKASRKFNGEPKKRTANKRERVGKLKNSKIEEVISDSDQEDTYLEQEDGELEEETLSSSESDVPPLKRTRDK
ncbi:unnamed protein product [Sphagnum jensenii]|uniref:Ubiquitin-like protease family profile domain-containing protein n=1 Tax=Sphagnum jensenii TaxID=128206 RepID=A0ABP0VE05_9BRYO